MAKLIRISCSDYLFNKNLNLGKVSACIDEVLIDNFKGKQVVLRGIQSEKHDVHKDQMIQQIFKNGYDRYASSHADEVRVSKKPIDVFGYACTIKNSPIVLPVLEGFHKWKPKSLERPQRRVDIWMVYEADQLTNIEYTHGRYGVKPKDGYVFNNPNDKKGALLGLIVID